MSVTLPALTPLEDSLFLTLYARALDNRRSHPILGDAAADQIVRTVDYDYDNLDVDTNLILSVALRAKKLDKVASEFLARHPDAVPSDRPAIIVADGLMGFLTHDEVVSLWNRLVSHFPEVAEFPPFWRQFNQLMAHSTTLSRMSTIVLHYRF